MNETRAPRVTIIPARPLLPAGRDAEIDVLIRIEPPALEGAGASDRRPLNLGIVLDRSGSMEGPKLARAKEAIAYAVAGLPPDDRVSLTIYDNVIETVVPSTPVSSARAAILAALPRIDSRNTTALHDAWVRGGLEVSGHLDPRRLNRVLLLSDGIANVGECRVDVLVTRAGELYARGVSTSTLGVGADFREDLMIGMAVGGGGCGWFIEGPEDFHRIFAAEFAGMKAQYGEKGALRIEARRRGTEVIGILNDFERAGDGWGIGSLHRGEPLDIVARVRARGGEPGQPLDLFDVRLSWEIPNEGRIEIQQLVRLGCDRPDRVAALPVDAEVDRVVALLEAARARRDGIRSLDAGQVAKARERWAGVAACMVDRSDRLGDREAANDAIELARLEKLLQEDTPEARRLARKLASYQAYSRTRHSRRSG